jgi:hypothetical protein
LGSSDQALTEVAYRLKRHRNFMMMLLVNP